jgi:hypothetical protein
MEPVLGPAKPDPGDCYCYLPLYIFSGPHLLAAKRRLADIDAAAEETARIVAQIRAVAGEPAPGLNRGAHCAAPHGSSPWAEGPRFGVCPRGCDELVRGQ